MILRTVGLIASWFIICCLLEALHGVANVLGLLPYPGKGVIGPIDWFLIVISVPLAITLNRVFRRRLSRPAMTDAQGRGGAHMSDHPLSIVRVTWLARYRKVLAETVNEGEAIFEADRSVRRAHGSSARTDMYNKQILVDHFKGKSSANDPKVQREFQLLRQQAEIDWNEMYAGKNSQATPKNIAEDYINNAKTTADMQRMWKRIKVIAVLAVVVVGVLIYALSK